MVISPPDVRLDAHQSHVETGDPSRGGEIVERALALNPRNAHAAHARTHARVELGEAAEGVAFLLEWLGDYDPDKLDEMPIRYAVARIAARRRTVATRSSNRRRLK